MNYVDLFTGIGGFALAASLVWENEFNPVMFCEIDLFCRRVLGKHWPDVPIIEDVRDEKAIADATGKYDRQHPKVESDRQKPQSGSRVVKGIDLLCGGPPCQPSSCAGLRKGTKDPRFLWPQALRAVEITKPEWIIFENPTGLLSLNGGVEYLKVLAHLEAQGYWTESFVVPASAVGAPHRRDRVWIVAESGQTGERRKRFGDSTCHATHPDFPRSPIREMQSGNLREELAPAIGDHWAMHWLQAVEQFCGVADGLSNRVDRHRRDRIKALGNSIVPQVAIRIMRAIQAADYAEIA